jgi:hypothetical protein
MSGGLGFDGSSRSRLVASLPRADAVETDTRVVGID